MPHINHNTFMPVPPNGHLKWPFEVPGSWWVIYDGHLFYSTCNGDGNLNFYSINRLEQVMLRCLISWLNHPWLYRSAPNNADHTGFMWVGGCKGCLSVLFSSSFFLNREWDREVASGRKNPSLLRALARCFLRPFLLFGILLYIGVSVPKSVCLHVSFVFFHVLGFEC